MPTLHLLRHAKSDWGDAGLSDHDRPLSVRGRRAAAAMAGHLRQAGVTPDLVLCSTARRAVDTLAAVRAALPDGVVVETSAELYAAAADQLLERLRQVPPRSSTVLLVGHNPGLEELALRLAGEGGDPAALRRLGRKYPTGALATLEFDGDWPGLSRGTARLASFVTPKDLG